MSEYSTVRKGKLKLKGSAGASFKKKKAKRKREHSQLDFEPGDRRHGTWHKVTRLEDIGESAIFETQSGGYVSAEDTGYFSVGDIRDESEQPVPGEIFTVVRISETRIALKSGYSFYVSVNSAGELIGRSEAIGPRETWEPVFEEGKLALCACNHRFVSVTSSKRLMAVSEKAKENEILTIYCDSHPHKKVKVNEEEEREERLASRDMAGFETSYVKRFQSFGTSSSMRVCGDKRGGLKKAKDKGKLHEELLDRREKMKSDRYCK